MKDILLKIIDEARFYPSGDNAQPFDFEIIENKILIRHNLLRGAHTLNPQNISSKLTLGFLIEAIVIASSQFQLSVEIHVSESEVDAELVFSKDHQLDIDPLCQQIKNRFTDRRAYEENIDIQVIQSLLGSDKSLNSNYFHLLKNEKNNQLKEYFKETDKLFWLWPKVFSDITKFIKFGAKHRVKLGLSPNNLGLKPIETQVTKLLANFPTICQILRNIGLLSKVSENISQKIFNTSPAFLLITTNDKDLILTGRSIFRSWTLLCANGYSLQPLSTAVIPRYSYFEGIGEDIPQRFKDFYQKNEFSLHEIFNCDKSHRPIYLFRIGKTAQAFPQKMKISRLDVNELLKAN